MRRRHDGHLSRLTHFLSGTYTQRVRAARILALILVLLAPAAAIADPDLALDLDTLQSDVTLDLLTFAPNACELQPIDLCVGGAGARKLLRFSVFVVNQGDTDLVLGMPDPNTLLPGTMQREWTFSTCHHHWHFKSFARYELRRHGETTPVNTGLKRSFCVEDTKAATSMNPRRYCCAVGVVCEHTGTQGVQVGWGDLYPSNLPCQWIDITDTPPGDYDLCVFVDTATLALASGQQDANPTNDSGCIHLPPDTIVGPSKAQPAPVVKVRAPHAHQKRRVGQALSIAWQRHVKGGVKVQEIWFSQDGGATYELIASGLDAKRRSYRWTIPAGAATEQARIKVIAWSMALQRGIGESRVFRVLP
jgi:hypothetical protein